MEEMIIKGKKIKTNNTTLQGVMELWQEIMGLQLNGDIYAVYSNYASNHLGDYDLLIGTESNDLPNSITLANCKYLEIPVAGNSIENVGKTWQEIWSNEDIEARRTYQTDYEKYGQDGSITIFLSIK